MTKAEAYSIIGGTEIDYQDKVISSIFEHKQFLLKSVITPQVFRTRARKFSVLNEAYCSIKGVESQEKSFQNFSSQLNIDVLNSQNLIQFYRSYEQLISENKLLFMQNNDPFFVAHYCHEIANIEDLKLITLSTCFTTFQVNNSEDVKISEYVNSGGIIKELLESSIEIITDSNLLELPTLMKDIIRSKKYVNFTELKKNKDA